MPCSSRRFGPLLGAACALAFVYACAPTPDPARVVGPDPAGDAAITGTGSSTSGGGEIPPLGNGDVQNPLAEGVVYAAEIAFDGTNAAHALAPDGSAPPAQANPDCLSCHGADTAKAEPTYLTGGLIYETFTGDAGTPCSGCDVFFVDATGRRVKVTTGADGTFAVLAAEFGAVGADVRVGIKKGVLGVPMPSEETINGAAGTLRGCNSVNCHRVGSVGPISLGSGD